MLGAPRKDYKGVRAWHLVDEVCLIKAALCLRTEKTSGVLQLLLVDHTAKADFELSVSAFFVPLASSFPVLRGRTTEGCVRGVSL